VLAGGGALKKTPRIIQWFILSTILGLVVLGLIMNANGFDVVKSHIVRYPVPYILSAIFVAFFTVAIRSPLVGCGLEAA